MINFMSIKTKELNILSFVDKNQVTQNIEIIYYRSHSYSVPGLQCRCCGLTTYILTTIVLRFSSPEPLELPHFPIVVLSISCAGCEHLYACLFLTQP